MKKKKVLVVLMTLTFMVSVCGCADTDTDTSSSSEGSESIAEEIAEQTAEESSLIPDDAAWLNGNAYYAYTEALSWEDAESYCNDLGGHLISINSADEQSLALELAQNTGKDNAWTGGYLSLDDVWAWTDGSSFSYTNWDASQPDCYDGTEFYIRFPSRDINYTETNWIAYEGKWNDTAMEGDSDASLSSFCFICEWEDGVVDENADVEISEHETEAVSTTLSREDVFDTSDKPIFELYQPNSAGGLQYFWADKYIGDMTINYYILHFEMYNAVDDPAYDEIKKQSTFTVKMIGPVESGEYLAAMSISDPDVYCETCEKLELREIELEYDDGTTATVEYGWYTTELDLDSSWMTYRLENNYPNFWAWYEAR